jgi:hypothetical protein
MKHMGHFFELSHAAEFMSKTSSPVNRMQPVAAVFEPAAVTV